MFSRRSPSHAEALERRYDGPVPPADPACPPQARMGRARLFQRMAAEIRAQAAGRRARLSGAGAMADDRLRRLGRDLGRARASGLAWLLA